MLPATFLRNVWKNRPSFGINTEIQYTENRMDGRNGFRTCRIIQGGVSYMKDWIRKISVSLLLAACEIALGLLLLINPVGLTSMVIILLGILLLLLGGYHLYRYIRLPREDAAKTWKLATGVGVIALGISAIANQHWLVQVLDAVTTLYGAMLLAAAFMKLQIAVDALRGSRPAWYLMAVSFLVTAVLATLLFLNIIPESAVWIVTGIVLLILAVLDGVYFVLGRKKTESK